MEKFHHYMSESRKYDNLASQYFVGSIAWIHNQDKAVKFAKLAHAELSAVQETE